MKHSPGGGRIDRQHGRLLQINAFGKGVTVSGGSAEVFAPGPEAAFENDRLSRRESLDLIPDGIDMGRCLAPWNRWQDGLGSVGSLDQIEVRGVDGRVGDP